MTAHTDKHSFETETSRITKRNDGIVKITFKDNAEISFQHAQDLLESISKIMAPESLLMVDGSKAGFVSARAQAELFRTSNISGVALIAPKWSDRITAENILKANQPIYPVKIFLSEDEALAWLKQLRNGFKIS